MKTSENHKKHITKILYLHHDEMEITEPGSHLKTQREESRINMTNILERK